MILAHFPQLIERLDCQFTGWGDDDCSKTVQGTPSEEVESFEEGDEEGEGFAGTGRG